MNILAILLILISLNGGRPLRDANGLSGKPSVVVKNTPVNSAKALGDLTRPSGK